MAFAVTSLITFAAHTLPPMTEAALVTRRVLITSRRFSRLSIISCYRMKSRAFQYRRASLTFLDGCKKSGRHAFFHDEGRLGNSGAFSVSQFVYSRAKPGGSTASRRRGDAGALSHKN